MNCRLRFFVISLGLLAACATSRTVVADEPSGVDRDMVKVAAVQISGYDKGETPRNDYDPVSDFVSYINRAGKDGAQLVVFPEYVLGHIAVPGPSTEAIAAAARQNSIYVIIGCWEEYADGRFANTALVFDREGQIMGKYHKTHAAIDHYTGQPAWAHPPADRTREWMIHNDPEWIMESGTDLPVFEFDFGTVGIMTCYDGWFPEPARVLSLKGAELIVWINGRGGSVEDFILQSTMFRSHVAMIATNQAYGSGTMIGDCSQRPARIIDRCPDKEESMITATINLQQIRKIRNTSRNFQQRRPDLYETLTKPKTTK
jgi:predicted amidohydrolase